MKMGKPMFAGAILMLATISNPAVNAALIPLDSPFGPDTIIRSTTTGIEWLKASLTQGLTYNQLLNELAPSERFASFSIATADEVTDLFTGYFGNLFFSSSDPDFISRAEKFVDLFGPTSTFDTTISVFGNYNPVVDAGSPAGLDIFGAVVRVVRPSDGPAFTESDSQRVTLRPDQPGSFFLNRSPIPEPVPWLILLTGILVMLGLCPGPWRASG